MTYAFGHHYLYGEHEPGKTSVWDKYKATPGAGVGLEGTSGAVLERPRKRARPSASGRIPASTRSCC